MVSEDGLLKFKIIYKKEFRMELGQEETIAKANQLLNLYRAVYPEILNINISKKHDEKIQTKQSNK